MTSLTPHVLQNAHWQVGILPQTGASITFGRMRYSGTWLDILRPTSPQDYGSSSLCASFVMLPWANRIGAGLLRFMGAHYALRTAEDGTARHGDVRQRTWTVLAADERRLHLEIRSTDHPDMNFPFQFSAQLEFTLEDAKFRIRTLLRSEDERPFPAGFGHHPYFVKPAAPDGPLLQIPCEDYFVLEEYLAKDAPQPLPPRLDFRELRPLDDAVINDLLTTRIGNEPARILYPRWNTVVTLRSDELFAHWVLYAPEGQPFFALEPQTNANDGFNLYDQHIPGSGVFVLQPGEAQEALFSLELSRI